MIDKQRLFPAFGGTRIGFLTGRAVLAARGLAQ